MTADVREERIAFEQWATTETGTWGRWLLHDLSRYDHNGEYESSFTDAAWHAWLARAGRRKQGSLRLILPDADPELGPWLYGITHGEPTPPGDFLRALAEAALRADIENYASLREALLAIRSRHPKYHCKHEPAWNK
jgi:hypothetical protein